MEVWAIDPGGVRRGLLDPIGCSAVFRDSDVGSWSVEVDAADELAQRMVDGWGVMIVDGPLRMSGPANDFDVTAAATVDKTITGEDELVRLRHKLTYPNPTRQVSDQDVARWTRKGSAETLIRDLIRVNAGPDALESRRSPGLVMQPDLGRGASITIDTRLKPVIDEARAAARLGGLTFSAVRVEPSEVPLSFRVPRDLSRRVRFSREGPQGGITEVELKASAPTCTTAIVAAQGEGAERDIYETTAPSTAWGERIEALKDRRDTSDTGALDQTGAEAVKDGAAKASATFKVAEVPGLVFGVDYQLGDIVSVAVGGVTISQPVRTAEVTWDGYGRTVALALGDTPDPDDPVLLGRVQDLQARVGHLEAN